MKTEKLTSIRQISAETLEKMLGFKKEIERLKEEIVSLKEEIAAGEHAFKLEQSCTDALRMKLAQIRDLVGVPSVPYVLGKPRKGHWTIVSTEAKIAGMNVAYDKLGDPKYVKAVARKFKKK